MPKSTKPYVGGQAVIEGVMMRSSGGISVAVRRPDSFVAVQEWPLPRALSASRVWKWPGIRGVGMLAESLSLGFRALTFSAEQQLSDSERASSRGTGRGAIAVSALFALGLFIALPQGLAFGLTRLAGLTLAVQDPRFHLLIGGFKLTVLLGYLLLISRIAEVRRVFQYHGAEHKTIYAYEKGLDLTVSNVQAQSTLHPRCGTTFLVVVIAVSIVVGSVATPLLLPNVKGALGQVLTLALRIGLLPAIAAVSYELQRLSARYCTKGPLQLLLWPGYLFQKITTREPDDAQVEIAIAAMKTALLRETFSSTVPFEAAPRVFSSIDELSTAVAEQRAAHETLVRAA